MPFISKGKKLRVLFVASEATPFIKVGGLGEVFRALPKALRDLGCDTRILIPRYASIPIDKFPMDVIVAGLPVSSGPAKKDIICNVKQHTGEDGAISYFLENQEYYEQRGSVYGYDDDAARWALLCRGALEFARHYQDWRPEIIVAADWQGGLLPNLVKTEYKDDPIISKIATVFSIHNLYFQGKFDHRFIGEMDYDDGKSPVPDLTDPAILKTNCMRRGIRYADIINTVSPTYAQEITTPAYGELLDPLLQERRSRLFGILNGIDYNYVNPETNSNVTFKYNAKKLSDRIKNKEVLQEKFNLHKDSQIPVIAIVSRLSEQKGLDLLVDMLEPLLGASRFQLIVLGTGESRYLAFFGEMDKKYEQVATHLSFDSDLPNVIYAGADIILIPSRFEPCGLTQMEAMRYGALPLVRKTGGLADSVENYDPEKDTGTGFVFEKYDKYEFFATVIRALETYKRKKDWEKIQKRAMAKNFSWEASAKQYLELFKKARDFNQLEEKS